MDASRFDALTRALGARPTSRRQLVGRLAAGLSGSLAVLGANAPAIAAKKNDDTPTPDQGQDDNGKPEAEQENKPDQEENNGAPACREAGHSCEGNQVCCAGLTCAPSGPGAANRCTAQAPAAQATTTSAPVQVAVAAAYSVQVACTYDAAADQSTCTCTGVAPSGAAPVRAIALPSAVVCAEVVGGDAALTATAPASGAVGFTSPSGQAVLTLVLTGKVTTAGSVTYWCTTDNGTVPAKGPGLTRVQSDISDTTGAIEVRAAACAIAAATSGYDYHGKCTRPAAGTGFTLAGANGTQTPAQPTGTAATDGRLRFGQLAPGTYALTQQPGDWCYAESDGADAQGNLVVKAGQRVTVWIFDCAGAK